MSIQEELRGLEKWINGNGKKVSAPPANYVPWFQKYAAQYSWMDSRFLMGMCWIESLFNPKAVSPAGAKGLSQFMPATAKLYHLADPFDPEDSIRAQAQFLNDMYQKLSFVHSEFDKLMIISVSYNAGEGGRIPMILKREAKNGKELKIYIYHIIFLLPKMPYMDLLYYVLMLIFVEEMLIFPILKVEVDLLIILLNMVVYQDLILGKKI